MDLRFRRRRISGFESHIAEAGCGVSFGEAPRTSSVGGPKDQRHAAGSVLALNGAYRRSSDDDTERRLLEQWLTELRVG